MGGLRAHHSLFIHVADYFRSAGPLEGKKVILTGLPPIYLQRPGHSLTVIGFEIRDDGSADLLVFDPILNTTPLIKQRGGNTSKASDPSKLLKQYRKDTDYFQKYNQFEVLE